MSGTIGAAPLMGKVYTTVSQISIIPGNPHLSNLTGSPQTVNKTQRRETQTRIPYPRNVHWKCPRANWALLVWMVRTSQDSLDNAHHWCWDLRTFPLTRSIPINQQRPFLFYSPPA